MHSSDDGPVVCCFAPASIFKMVWTSACFQDCGTRPVVFTNGSKVCFLPDANFPHNRSAFGSLDAAVDEHVVKIP